MFGPHKTRERKDNSSLYPLQESGIIVLACYQVALSCNLQHFGTVYRRTIMDHVSTHIDVLVVAETFPWLEIRCDVLRLVHWIRFQPLNHHDIQQLSTLEGAK